MNIADERTAIPESWEMVAIGGICDLKNGYAFKPSDWTRNGLKIVRIQNLNNPDAPYNHYSGELRDRFIIDSGDLLFAWSGTPGTSFGAHIWHGKKAALNQHIFRVDFDGNAILKAYFMYAINQKLTDLIDKARGGVGLRHVTKGKFEQTEIELPPFPEQHRIVAKIEELFSELDKGIESLKTAREQLKLYRQSVLKHAFEGKLTAQWSEKFSATSWTQTTLGEQLSFLTSGSRGWAKFYADQGDIFIRAQNLKHDHLDLEDVAYVELPDRSEGMRTRVQAGDLLITITGANVTKTGFVKPDIGTAFVSQHVALVRLIENCNTEFFYWFLVAEVAGRKQLTKMAYGAGKPGLNLENIRSVKITLPSPKEQAEIVSQINAMLSIQETAIINIDEQIRKCEVLRQSILKKAFSGQLVEQDPNDEPASVLLERIRAEKAKQQSKPRGKRTKRKAAQA